MSTINPSPAGPSPMPAPGPNPGINPVISPDPIKKPRLTRQRKQLLWGLFFLGPNLTGFLIFTLIPLILSLVLAFSNWDLRLHNMFKDERVKFIGFEHFTRLFTDENFWKYLGNTLFFMIGLPIGISLSLISAIILSQDLKGGSRKAWVIIALGAIMIGSCSILAAYGMGGASLTILLSGMFGLIIIGGSLGGQTVYRTLFYIPNFTAGVATMLLWKKMYNPVNGPVNEALAGPVRLVGNTLGSLPQSVMNGALILMLILACGLIHLCATRVLKQYRDGEIGIAGVIIAAVMLLIAPASAIAAGWLPASTYVITTLLATLLAISLAIWRAGINPIFDAKPSEGVGSALMLSISAMVGAFALIGIGLALWQLPLASSVPGGLAPPSWLQDPGWAKPALMLMGLWGAVGSQTMLLYLAALTNVPGELYEAADIDGASRNQKFWNVTWPQLAPTTFFVVVMGVIGGLQGGFEMARVMTQGGPAGSTTTLAYFIYTEGFETGRLGFSSAVSWTMFLLVLVVTLFNWKFGNRYVND